MNIIGNSEEDLGLWSLETVRLCVEFSLTL